MEAKTSRSGDRFKPILLVGVVAMVLGVFILLQIRKPSDSSLMQPLVNAGMTAPDFVLPDLQGQMVRLSDYRGKVVFLNIWATWCSPCRQEMPSMEKLYNEMKGEAFEILAVSIDILGAKAVAPFMEEFNLSFPALLDPEGSVKRRYGVSGVPETFVIDKSGIVAAKIIGPRDWTLPEAVNALKQLSRRPAISTQGGSDAAVVTTKPSGARP